MESISGGTFSVPGGHKLYLEALNKVKQDYELVPRKGVKVRNKGGGENSRVESEVLWWLF